MSKNYFEAALDFSEDYKPVKYWENEEIEMIWFTRRQLNQFIKHIVESEKTKTEK
ncbi:hypothetical protein [Dysgonomonas sp. Marseille-P4361]|uniref:hypothetical protein n=1 Tax=Dysgonomonas sp. Marseille-P4361 TaxID=2161820 RepID=UPI00135BFA1F|nr:hypothetical protein [Dysgonomonas sp. Marseille-P4361]